MNLVMPHFPLMHEMTTDHVHEEIQLLANDFSTMLFETLAHVPRWRDYYLAHDQTPHYEYLADPAEGAAVPARRSALAAQVAPAPRAVAGAGHASSPASSSSSRTAIPAPVVLSMLAMLTYTARMHRSPVPVQEIAATWVDRLALMLGALVRDRDAIPPERSIDVRSTSSWPTSWRSPSRCTPSRRAAGRRCARGDRQLSGAAINVAGTARWRRRPRCSASTSATCASRSLRTLRVSWADVSSSAHPGATKSPRVSLATAVGTLSLVGGHV